MATVEEELAARVAALEAHCGSLAARLEAIQHNLHEPECRGLGPGFGRETAAVDGPQADPEAVPARVRPTTSRTATTTGRHSRAPPESPPVPVIPFVRLVGQGASRSVL
ncbi:MAG TPA: hypothetical protein VHV82_13305 [Sporichthyaceae bacterium]|jgi:hypothetical protein|nr:hypothetical protein [Sporichthyaceae bacterium]